MQTLNLIGASWSPADSGRTFVVHNPATDEVVAEVPLCMGPETRRAIEAAEAVRSDFERSEVADRVAMLRKISLLMEERKETLAKLITLEQGKPLSEALTEVTYARGFYEVAADEAPHCVGDTHLGEAVPGKEVLLQPAPVGVTASIIPWNFPVALLAKKLAPALAVGCPQILKPAEETPLVALEFAQLCLDAGVPLGVVSVLTGSPEAIGGEMLSNPYVRKISFTGSTEVGRFLRKNAGPHLPQLTLERGGHAPFIVMEGCDLDSAVAGALAAKFRNGGQACISPNRFLVEASIHDEFVERLCVATAGLTVGNGMESGVDIGPLVNDATVEKVEQHVADALEQGAECLLGGERVHIPGLADRFFAPTILTRCGPEMLCFQEETFGPVCPVRAVADEREALQVANDSNFGLAGFLWAGDRDQALRMSKELEVGIVGAHDASPAQPQVPFGGVKQSGWGREGGKHALEEFAPVKTISIGL